MSKSLRNLLGNARVLLDEAACRTIGALRLSSSEDDQGLRAKSLEERVLFSATPIDLASAAVTSGIDEPASQVAMVLEQESDLEQEAANQEGGSSQEGQPASEQRLELVFVDRTAEDYEQLLEDLIFGSDDSRRFEVVLLDSDRDGVEQISDAIGRHDDIDAVHVVSHGTSGSVKLGNVWLNSGNLTAYAGEIAGWAGSFASDADVLFYGCELAATEEGRTFVEAVGVLCDCDVAASDDDTGHSVFGGDWDLEFTTGDIETNLAFSQAVQQNWMQLLNVSVDASSSGGTADQLSTTISHTTSGTNRLMLVGVTTDPHGESVASVTYNGVALTFVGAEENGHSRAELWSLVAPDTGTHDVIVTMTGTGHRGVAAGVMTFTDVNQATPLLNFSSAAGSSTTASASVTSATDDLVFSVVHSHNGASSEPGAGQTEHFDTVFDQSNISGTTAAGASTVNTSWTVNNEDWTVAAVSIQAVTNSAQVATFSAAQDTFIQASDSVANSGTSASLVVDRQSGDLQRALVQFDLSSLPAGTAIQSATLKLQSTQIGGALTIDAYQLLESWSEGSVTWDERVAGTNWSTAGGAFNTTAIDSITTNATGQHAFDVTALAGDWVAGAAQNHGILIASMDGGGNRTVTYDSREGTVVPVLEIAYTVTNDPPTDISPGSFVVNEGLVTTGGFSLGRLNAVDSNVGETFSWSIQPGGDAAAFSIGGTSNDELLIDDGALDFETKASYSVTVRATDSAGNTYDELLTVGVRDVIEQIADVSEFRANETSIDIQETSGDGRGSRNAIAIANDGSYTVVWSSINQDGSGWGIYARRFDSTGAALTGEILVAQTATDNQQWGQVASDATGNFVVTWTSSSQDGSPQSVYARRFDAAGNAVSGEFRVNTQNNGTQKASAIAMSASGDFVIAWEGQGPGDADGIFYRRFDSLGAALDVSDVLANETGRGLETSVDVDMNDKGQFAIVWHVGNDLYLRHFDSDGPVTGDVRADTGIANGFGGSIGIDASGRTTVAYRTDGFAGIGNGVSVRGFESDGTQRIGRFSANGGDSTASSIDVDDNGNFTVVWERSSDADGKGVYVRRYDSNGSEIGITGLVNVTETGDQQMASVAMLNPDNFVVTWSGQGADDNDGVFVRQVNAIAPSIDLDADDSSGSTGTGFSVNFSNGSGATNVVDSDAILSDPNNANLQSLVITITDRQDGADELLAADTTGTSIVADFNSSAGRLTLSGDDTVANYQQVLRTVTYDNAQNPATGVARTISFVANDGMENSDVATTNVSIVAAVSGASGVTANVDSYSVDEDGNLAVAVAGVLGNDTPSPVAGNTLGHSAQDDTNGDAIWDNTTAQTGFDWDFSGGGATYTTTPTTNLVGIDAAWVLDGTGGGTADSFNTLPGDPTTASASFELWFNPSDAVGQEIIFEVGSSGQGTALSLNGSTIELQVRRGGANALVSYDAAAEIAADEYIHVIGAVDLDSAVPDLHLYVNGVLVDSEFDVSGLNFWANSGDSGLGMVNGNTPTSNTSNFQGEIAVFTLYEEAVDAAETQRNFDAVAGSNSSGVLSATNLDTTGTLGNVALTSDGSFTYDPNGQFESLQAGATATDVFRYTADDGTGTAVGTVSITITGVNDLPALTGIEGADAVFTEGGGAIAITNSLVVGDVDDTHIESATVQITGNYANGQDVLAFTNTAGINGTWDQASGTLTLLGSDTLANYEAALRAITFENTSQSPSVAPRTIRFTVNDGSAASSAVTRDVVVNSVNDAPTISSLAGDSLSYSVGIGAQVIEQGGDAIVADDDSSDFDTGELRVSIVAGGSIVDDILSIQNQGAGIGNISTVGTDVLYDFGAGPVVIGSFSGGAAGVDLTVSLNSNATSAASEALVKSITFENVLLTTATTRTVRFTISDGDGATSLAHDTTVAFNNVLPVANDDTYSVDENGSLTTAPDWFDQAWQQRQRLTFNNTAQSQTLTDAPILVKLDAGKIDYSKIQAAGQDMRFVAADGSLLEYEIEAWDPAGESFVWVKVPQVTGASGTDFIYMYYSNTAATDAQNAAAVWGGSYEFVTHLNDDFLDSSGNGNHGTNLGSGDAAFQIADGQDFGADDRIDVASSASVDNLFAGGGTISAWIDPDTFGENDFGRIIDKATATSATSGWSLQMASGNRLLFEHGFDGGLDLGRWSVAGVDPASIDGAYHVAVTFDSNSSANDPIFYINGESVTVTETRTPTGAASDDTGIDIAIGNRSGQTDRDFDGLIDEVRFSRGIQSADWIAAQYLSMTDAFVTFSAAEGPGGVLTNDTDADANPITATLVSGPTNAAAFSLASDGSFTYTPNVAFDGIDTFTYTANDWIGNSNLATVTVTVNNTNDAPVADAGPAAYAIAEGGLLELDASGSSDIDGDTLTFAWDLDGDGVFDDAFGETTSVGWTTLGTMTNPIIDEGSYTISVQVSDGTHAPVVASQTLTVVNTAPRVTATGTASIASGSTYTLNLSATDAGDDTITHYTIDWGDGTVTTVAAAPSVTHTYTNLGFTNNILIAAIDEDGTHAQNLIVVGSTPGNNAFLFNADGTFDSTMGSLADGLEYTSSVAHGPDGNLYVSGATSDNVLRYAPDGTFLGVAASGGGLDSPVGIAFGADGSMYVASYNDDTVKRFDPATNTYLGDFISGAAGLDGPSSIAFGADGNLYVASLITNEVYRFDGTTGAQVGGAFVSAGLGALNAPEQMAFDGNGDLYVAGRLSNMVHKFSGTDGSHIMNIGDGSGIDGAMGIDIGADGLLYVSSRATDTIMRFNPTTGDFVDNYITATPSGLDDPVHFTFIASHQVTVQNNAPTITSPLSVAILENETVVQAITTADIDGHTVTLSLTGGSDQALFSIDGSNQLVFSVVPDFETPGDTSPTDNVYEVQVTADDGNGGTDVQTIVVTVDDANEAPSIALDNITLSLLENTSTTGGLDVADIVVTDDALGTETITLSGADAASFEVIGSTLRLRDGVTLDFETKSSYVVRVNIDDATLGTGIDDFVDYTLTIFDVNEAPSVSIVGATTTLPEMTSTVGGIDVADIVITDDALGAELLTLSGADVGSFEIVGAKLRLRDGVDLDFETQDSYTVRVNVDDATIGNGIDSFVDYTLTLSDVNDVAVVSNVGTSVTYLEDDGWQQIAGDIELYDQDDSQLQSATIYIASGYDIDQDSLVFDGTTALTHTWDSATGTLTFLGAGSVADYQNAIRSVGFLNENQSPTEGVRQIALTVNDGTDTSAVQTRDFDVVSVNDAPLASDDSFAAVSGEELRVDATEGTLVNDSDIEGDPLIAQLITGPEHGSLTLNPDGSFTYKADVGFVGVDTFTYTSSDGALASAPAVVEFRVEAVALVVSNSSESDAASSASDSSESITPVAESSGQLLDVGSLTQSPSDDDDDDELLGLKQQASIAESASRSSVEERVKQEEVSSQKEQDFMHYGNKPTYAGIEGATEQRRMQLPEFSMTETTFNRLAVTDYACLCEPGPMLAEFDALKDQFELEFSVDTILTSTAGFASSGLTVGLISYFRGYALMAMVAQVTQVSLVRSLDPLVILQGVGLDAGSSETLQDIMRAEQERLATGSEK